MCMHACFAHACRDTAPMSHHGLPDTLITSNKASQMFSSRARAPSMTADLEGGDARETGRVRHKTLVQEDVSILHAPQRNLVLDLGGTQPARPLAHNERIHLHHSRARHNQPCREALLDRTGALRPYPKHSLSTNQPHAGHGIVPVAPAFLSPLH